MRSIKLYPVIAIIFILLILPSHAKSCASGSSYTHHLNHIFPETIGAGFLDGKLGIISAYPSKTISFLVYQQLRGIPIPENQKSAWRKNLINGYLVTKTKYPKSAESASPQTSYLNLRNKVASKSPHSIDSVMKGTGFFNQYLNCTDSAFIMANKTLKERIALFSIKSDAVQLWIKAQDMVFDNCSNKEASIPPDIEANAPPLLAFDRDYQKATAYFYAEDYKNALELFRSISNEKDSPWRGLAKLLVGRTLIRMGTNREEWGYDETLLEEAYNVLEEGLADESLKPLHPAFRSSWYFVAARIAPATVEAYIINRLAKNNYAPVVDIQEGLEGFYLTEKSYEPDNLAVPSFQDDPLEMDISSLSTVMNGKMASYEDNEFSLWYQAMKGNNQDMATEKWIESGSREWLVAAIAFANIQNAPLAELIEATDKLDKESPAYPTVSYHATRLLCEQGNSRKCHSRINSILEQSDMGLSSKNIVRELKATHARNLLEFLEFSQMETAIGYYSDGYRPRLYTDGKGRFDDDSKSLKKKGSVILLDEAKNVLDAGLPVDVLVQLVNEKKDYFTPIIYRKMALATWVRAVLIDRTDVALRLIPTLRELYPDSLNGLDYYNNAKSAEERKFAGLAVIASKSSASPLISTSNPSWWCDLEGLHKKRLFASSINLGLSSRQQRILQQELYALGKINEGGSYIAYEILKYAKKHTDNPRVPETLHKIITGYKYGCSDKSGLNYSAVAYEFMHEQYPNNTWTNKTKYWYDSRY